MTEKEALEKLKKDILDLADQKQLLVLQVHELAMRKRVHEDRLQDAQKKATEIESDNAKRVEDCLLKVKLILTGAEAKESEFITKLQLLTKWEQELAEKEQEQKDLSISLVNRMVELAKDKESFELEYSRKSKTLESEITEAKRICDDKYAALSRETARYESLVAELDQKQALHAESQARHEDTALQLETLRNSLLDKQQLIQQALIDIRQRENDSSTTLGRLKALQEDLDCRAASIHNMEKGLHEKEIAADLKKRELDIREKKIQSLINIHKLEKEIAELS
jgi:hypothetical protein